MPCLPGNPIPDPVETEEGINLARIKTVNIHDGLFDGELELRIELIQSLANFSVDASGPFNLAAQVGVLANKYQLMNQMTTHDAGHWYWYWYEFRFRNSNK